MNRSQSVMGRAPTLAILSLAAVMGACGGGADISYIGVPSASASVISSDSMSLKADGVSYATVTVEVRDNNRNLIPSGGYSVSLATTRGVLSDLQDTNSGRYVATIKSTQTGPATVTGVVEGAKIPQDLVLTFVAP